MKNSRQKTLKLKGGASLASSDYRPEYKMSDDNIISKGLAYVGKNILYPILKPLLYKKRGGKKAKDMTVTEKQALDDARTSNAIWAKSKAGKEYKSNLSELTDREKLANARNTSRKYYKDVYEPKKAQMQEVQAQQIERRDQAVSRKQLGEEVEYQKEQRRLQAEAEKNKKSKSIWDDIADVAIGEVVNLLPVPKIAKDIIKTGTKEGYKAISGKLQGGDKSVKSKIGLSLNISRQQPLLNQYPELEGNKLLDKLLTDNVFNYQNELIKNNMRQGLAYPVTSLKLNRDDNNNKVQILDKMKYVCECGSEINKAGKTRHIKSKKHINFIDLLQ